MSDVGGATAYTNAILTSAVLPMSSPQCKVRLSYHADSSMSSLLIGHTQDGANKTIYSQLFWQVVSSNKTWNTLDVVVGQRPDGKKFEIIELISLLTLHIIVYFAAYLSLWMLVNELIV